MERRRVRTASRLNHCLHGKSARNNQREKRGGVHDEKSDEVDGTRFVQLLGVVVLVNCLCEASKRKPQRREADTVPLEVPVRYVRRRSGLDDAHEPVALHDQLPVHKSINADFTRRPHQHICFGRLVCQCCRLQGSW
jgi:hypothetical protein